MPLKTFLFGMAFTYFETGIAVLLCHGNHQKMVIQIEVWFNRKSTIIIYLWLIDSKSSPTFCMFHLPFWKEIFLLAIYKKKKKTALSQRKKAHSLKLKKCFFHLRLRNWRNIFKESQHYHTMGAGSLNFFSTLWTNRSHFRSWLHTHTHL